MRYPSTITIAASLTILAIAGCNDGHREDPNKSKTGAGSTAAATSSSTTASAAPHTITQVAPQSGPQDGGTPVTITGSGFTANGAAQAIVLFGSAHVVATPISDTEIQVTAPLSLTPGQSDVRVVNDNGVATSVGAWTYDARTASLEFNPPVGHHELGFGGTRITLTVKDFVPLTANTTVNFGATAATTVTLVDATTLIAEIGQGTAPGTVDITIDEAGTQVTAPGFVVQDVLAYGDLTINEVMGNPGGVDTNNDDFSDVTGDEFIEIVNTTGRPVDLSYLSIKDTFTERHRFPNPTTVPTGGSIVVFGSGTPMGFGGPHETSQAQQATDGTLGLNNTSETITLQSLPGINGIPDVVFVLQYSSIPTGSTLTNVNDGQKITANPATDADYVDHSTVTTAGGAQASPGKKTDGKDF